MQKPKLVYTTYIRSTPKKVWDAITQPKFTRQYWGGLALVSDWKQDSTWDMATAGEKPEIYTTGKVLESTPPKRLVLSWVDPENLKDVSRVTYEIEIVKDAVCLTVTHDQFKARSTMPGRVNGGWPRVLSSLKSFLETGQGLAAAKCG
jgi:uncharacterized protein YndB with AHSA1/START domain